MSNETPCYLPLRIVAEQLNVNVATLRTAIRNGKLQANKLGHGYRVTQEWLDTWLETLIVTKQPTEQGDNGHGNTASRLSD